jgi:hypothetical protein
VNRILTRIANQVFGYNRFDRSAGFAGQETGSTPEVPFEKEA